MRGTEMKLESTTIEGQTVRVGDYVSFKSDIEQSARVIEIRSGDRYRGAQLVFEAPAGGFQGEYDKDKKPAF
jgi:hypothetical protein